MRCVYNIETFSGEFGYAWACHCSLVHPALAPQSVKVVPLPRKAHRARPSLSPIDKKLDDTGGSQPPSMPNPKNLLEDPGTGVPPAPQTSTPSTPPPTSPPFATPLPPVTAYCIPMTDDLIGSGCLLHVAQAAPGSSVLFRLTSSVGERADVPVKLADGQTYGHETFLIPEPKVYQANLTGTVEYEGQPGQTWPVTAADPGARLLFKSRVWVPRHLRNWVQYKVEVTITPREKILVHYFMFDPSPWSAPPPPSRGPLRGLLRARG